MVKLLSLLPFRLLYNTSKNDEEDASDKSVKNTENSKSSKSVSYKTSKTTKKHSGPLIKDDNFRILHQDYAVYSDSKIRSTVVKIPPKNDIGEHLRNPKVCALYKTVSGLKIALHKRCNMVSGYEQTSNGLTKCVCEHCGAADVVNDSLKSPLLGDHVPLENEDIPIPGPSERHRKNVKSIEEKHYHRIASAFKHLDKRVTALENRGTIRRQVRDVSLYTSDIDEDEKPSGTDKKETNYKIIYPSLNMEKKSSGNGNPKNRKQYPPPEMFDFFDPENLPPNLRSKKILTSIVVPTPSNVLPTTSSTLTPIISSGSFKSNGSNKIKTCSVSKSNKDSAKVANIKSTSAKPNGRATKKCSVASMKSNLRSDTKTSSTNSSSYAKKTSSTSVNKYKTTGNTSRICRIPVPVSKHKIPVPVSNTSTRTSLCSTKSSKKVLFRMPEIREDQKMGIDFCDMVMEKSKIDLKATESHSLENKSSTSINLK